MHPLVDDVLGVVPEELQDVLHLRLVRQTAQPDAVPRPSRRDQSLHVTTLHHPPYTIYCHNLWDDGGVGHGGQQGRLGGPRPRARAHHLRLGRRVRRVLRGAVEDLHNRGMY